MILKGDIFIGSGGTVLKYQYDTVTREHWVYPLEGGIHRYEQGVCSTTPGLIVNLLVQYADDKGCYSDGKVAELIRHLMR